MYPIQAVLKSIAERKADIDAIITSGFGPGASLMYAYCSVTKDHFGRDAVRHTQPNAYDIDASNAIKDFGPSDGTGNRSNRPFRFTVTLLQEDRDGDVVVPRGLETKNYFHNPVWFFGHQSYQIPIGLARPPGTRDKKYDSNTQIGWYPEEHRVQSDLYIDWLDPDAAFIGGKIERGLLNCTSIAFVPIEAERRGYTEEKAQPRQSPLLPPGWVFHRADVTEVSIVGIPANAGAYRDIMDQEKSFMSPKLLKGWKPYCAQAKGCWNGWCPCPPNPDGTCGPCEKETTSIVKDLKYPIKGQFSKPVEKYIRHENGKYVVHAESGKILGKHDSKEKAEAQLRAIEANKHKNDKEAKSMAKKSKCGCKSCKEHKPCPCAKKKGSTQADTEAAKPIPYRELLPKSKDPKDGPQIQNGKKTSPKGKKDKGLSSTSGAAGGYTLANANATSGTTGKKKPKDDEEERHVSGKDKVQVTKKKPKAKSVKKGDGYLYMDTWQDNHNWSPDVMIRQLKIVGNARMHGPGIVFMEDTPEARRYLRQLKISFATKEPTKSFVNARLKAIKNEEDKNVMDDADYAFAGEQTPEEEALEAQMGEQQPHPEYDNQEENTMAADDTDQDMDADTDADDGGDEKNPVKAGAMHYAKNIAHVKELDDWNEDQLPKHEPEVGEHFAPHHDAIKKLHSDMTDSFNERYPDHDLDKIIKGMDAGPAPDEDPSANMEGEEGMVDQDDVPADEDDSDEDSDDTEEKDEDVSDDEGTEADEEDVGEAGETDDERDEDVGGEGPDNDASTEEILERYRKPKSGSVVAVFTGQRMNVYGKVLKVFNNNMATVQLRGGKVIKQHVAKLAVVKSQDSRVDTLANKVRALMDKGSSVNEAMNKLGLRDRVREAVRAAVKTKSVDKSTMGAIGGGLAGGAVGSLPGAVGGAMLGSQMSLHTAVTKAADHMDALREAPDLPKHHHAGLELHSGSLRKALDDMGSQDSGTDELADMGSQDSGEDELTNEGNPEEEKVGVDYHAGVNLHKDVDWNDEGDDHGQMSHKSNKKGTRGAIVGGATGAAAGGALGGPIGAAAGGIAGGLAGHAMSAHSEVDKDVDDDDDPPANCMHKGDSSDEEEKCSGMTSKQQEDYWARKKALATKRFSDNWFQKTGEKLGNGSN